MSDAAAQDRRALEDFVVGNEDLERLEAFLDEFNIFEAMGVVRRERSHSDLLAFLLDPRGNHGLGAAFMRRLLQRVLTTAGGVPVPVTPIELELWNLDRTEVRREWRHIDILLLLNDRPHRLAVLIENKIWTGEHSDQLRRYLGIMSQHYRGRRVLGLYLTPDGEPPSHEAYLPVSYTLIGDVLEELAESRASILNPDVRTLLLHYTEMLRRHIVGDSEIARLCRQIYQQHKRAIDLIYEHRPDVQAEIQGVVEGLGEAEAGLELDEGSESKIRFAVRDWDTPALLTATGWTTSGRILLFEVWNYPGSLEVKLYVGPGPDETRQGLLDMARAHPGVLHVPRRPSVKWTPIFSRRLLEQEAYEDVDAEERENEIRRRWAEFLRADLPQIDAALREDGWI